LTVNQTEAQRYHGWTNHQTGSVARWLDNEAEPAYYAARRIVQAAGSSRRERGEALQAYVEDLAEKTCPGVISGASMVADIFRHALAGVDWDEIADHVADK